MMSSDEGVFNSESDSVNFAVDQGHDLQNTELNLENPPFDSQRCGVNEMAPISPTLSLRQWIENALNSVGKSTSSRDRSAIASSGYLAAALKIAISLTEHIDRVEELASNGSFDQVKQFVMASDSDWAGCVEIKLESNGQCDQKEGKHDDGDAVLQNIEPLPYKRVDDSAEDQRLDAEMKSFVESWDPDFRDAFEEMGIFDGKELFEDLPINSWEGAPLHHGEATAAFQDEEHQDGLSSSKGLDYLKISSAEFCLPGNYVKTTVVNTDSEARRIYLLALVFLELFSGGDKPSFELLDLISATGAFVYLSKQSVFGRSDGKQYPQEAASSMKRRLSATDKEQCDDPCSLACNRLKVFGVPNSICKLIFDMLDCIHGDQKGNESYSSVKEVTKDLQLMIDKPKFLRNLDMMQQSRTGLQIPDAFISRHEEIASVISCYHRSISGSNEIAVIAGEQGIGKTWLAEKVGKHINAEGGIFLHGKFEMHQSKPFSAFASAFDQFLDILLSKKGSDWANAIVQELNARLGQGAWHLIQLIPKLGIFISRDHIAFKDPTRALQQLSYLICQFVDVISSNAKVTICIDNLQRADVASILVMNQLLMKQNKTFFFLGCFQNATSVNDTHPFWDIVEQIFAFGIKSTIINLECMSTDALTEVVSEMLCLSPRVVRPLGDILYTNCQGNVQFFIQLMRSLYHDKLLVLSLPLERWTWNIGKIISMKLPDNVAICFANEIHKLSQDVQLSLQMLSLFGESTKSRYIFAIESSPFLDIIISKPLEIAAAEGLVRCHNGEYEFTHARIQSAAYQMFNEEDRQRYHNLFGLCLMKYSSDLNDSDDDVLFTACDQLNFAGPSIVSNETDKLTILGCNLKAAKRAMAMADFKLAEYLFSHCVLFLPVNHWEDDYDLSLELFDLAAKCAVVTTNTSSLQHFADEVARHAKCFNDKLEVSYCVMTNLVTQSKIPAAVEYGLAILTQLDEPIRSDNLAGEISYTNSLIKGMSEADFLNHKLMEDKTKLITMKYIAKLELLSFMVRPELHPFITMKLVQLSCLHGLSPVSPVGFAFFGSMLAKIGDIKVGNGFAQLARSLVDKLSAKDCSCEVYMVTTELDCFVKPLQSLNDQMRDIHEACLATGDNFWLCIGQVEHCSFHFWSGVNLHVVHETMSNSSLVIKERQHLDILLLLLVVQRTVWTLSDKNGSPADVEILRKFEQHGNPRQLAAVSLHKIYVSILFNDSTITLKKHIEEYLKPKRGKWLLLNVDSVDAFLLGMSAYRMYRETRDESWAATGRKHTHDMEEWATKGCEHNFLHKLQLLKAEGYYSSGNAKKAEVEYLKSIESSRRSKFINDEALACECAAQFYLENGDVESSLAHFKLAVDTYKAWGAVKKAEKIGDFIEMRFKDPLANSEIGPATRKFDETLTNSRKRRDSKSQL